MPEEKDMSTPEQHSEKFDIGSSQEDIEKFQEPSWKKKMPDIRMQLGDQDQGAEAGYGRPEIALEQAEQQRSREIVRFEQNTLLTAKKPEAIRLATRELTGRYEAVTNNSPALDDRYGLLNTYHGVRSRAAGLRTGGDEELVEYLGLREDRLVGHRWKIPDPLELRIELIKKIPDDLTSHKERENWLNEQLNQELAKIYSEPEVLTEKEKEKRDTAIKELERSGDEMEVREKFDELWATYQRVSGSLTDFYRIYFAPENELPVARDWRILFNLPATAEQDWSAPEAHKERLEGHMGNRIDLGIRLYMIAALSERKAELNRIINSPGFKIVEEAMDKVVGDGKGVGHFIGSVDDWRSQEGRYEEGVEEMAEKRGNRGPLTWNGNVFARKEDREQKLEVDETIAKILGGDKAAQELARRLFFLTGLAPYYGVEFDKMELDGKGNMVDIEVEIEGVPHTDARERIMNFYGYAMYKRSRGEWGGPDIAYGRYPKRLATDLFRFTSTPNPEIDKREKVEPIPPNISEREREKLEKERKMKLEQIAWEKFQSQRSLWELMWDGWDGQKALRLGEIPWESLKNFFWKDYMIRVNYAGNKGMLFDIYMGAEDTWRLNNFLNVRWWRKYVTARRVCLGSWSVTDGENNKWYKKNEDKIKSKARKLKQKKEAVTGEGAMEKAAKNLLKEQIQAGIAKADATLVRAIDWWYDRNIEPKPENWVAIRGNIHGFRKRAGVLLSGEG